MSFEVGEAVFAPIIQAIFLEHNIPPAWGMAFARQESGFNPNAQNRTGGDGKRGGSYGLFQVSWETARELAREHLDAGISLNGPHELLTSTKNTKIAALLIADLRRRFGPNNLEDVAAAYNSGKPFVLAPEATRLLYVPHIMQYARDYGWEPPKK